MLFSEVKGKSCPHYTLHPRMNLTKYFIQQNICYECKVWNDFYVYLKSNESISLNKTNEVVFSFII